MKKQMTVFFAGGGTGGHIYPAIAVAEKLRLRDVNVCFFCSQRSVDTAILDSTGYRYIRLPAQPLEAKASFVFGFIRSFFITCKELISSRKAVVVGVGGFVAAPVVIAAKLLGKPLAFINVDIVPGKANRRLARLSKDIFVQFESSKDKFGSGKFGITVSGCPLRARFDCPDPATAKADLDLDSEKNTLLITGASSGAQNINNAVATILDKLSFYKEDWQIVHITGIGKKADLEAQYNAKSIKAAVVEYYEDMPSLLALSDAAIGRSGAVSVAEFAAAQVPVVCVPYPYHQDRHQLLNAMEIAKDGGAMIITDHKENYMQTSLELWAALEPILKDTQTRKQMKDALSKSAKKDAAKIIANRLLELV